MSERVETQDVSIALALKLAGGACAMLIACALLIVWIAPGSLHPRPSSVPSVPAPVLQINPRADMARFKAEEEAEMTSYGWVDRDKGVVRLPIGLAMAKVAKDGIAGWPAEAR
ncbi:MAG TPA: hypothetical protein VKP60_01675 [Magnetospirillaceae bacterium]|nr:hypothetical protein [Magnetospirillaceae bacterium]